MESIKQPTQAIAVLNEARRLILAGWCRGAFAKDIEDQVCDVSSDEAVRFCAIGAIHRARLNMGVLETRIQGILFSALCAAAKAATFPTIADWNDNCSDAAAVVEGFERARLELAALGDQP